MRKILGKKIIIEADKLRDLYCGLGQYCLHLSNSLKKIDNNLTLFTYPQCVDDKTGNYHFIKRWMRKIPYFALKALSRTMPSYDLWHVTHQDSEFFNCVCAKKKVLTIHDLNFLSELPLEESERKRAEIQTMINRSDALVFISNFTKNEVCKNFDLPNKLIQKVIYNGVSFGTEKEKVIERLSNCKFLFSIGTVVAKKNFHVLLDMLIELPSDFKVAVAGSCNGQYAIDLKAKIVSLRLEDRFILLGKITESEKRWLYANCAAFVFPSLLEGFGIPVVEAMSYGRPLILSDKTSIPEIGGSEAAYFKSFKGHHMAECVLQEIERFNDQKAQKLMDRAKEFNWNNSAAQYYALYSELLVK